MPQLSPELDIYKRAFLELFPEECQEDCLVARIAAAGAARQFAEADVTFDKAIEVYAHRFGRCALGPKVVGRCGKKSVCRNDMTEGIKDPLEAAEVLTVWL